MPRAIATIQNAPSITLANISLIVHPKPDRHVDDMGTHFMPPQLQ
jgi:hypothetical protein